MICRPRPPLASLPSGHPVGPKTENARTSVTGYDRAHAYNLTESFLEFDSSLLFVQLVFCHGVEQNGIGSEIMDIMCPIVKALSQ